MDKKTILTVDDEQGFTELVKQILEELGDYEVKVENKGKEAFSAAQKYRPDLILLDIMMPDKDGVTIARSFEADEELSKIPIVFITALVTSEYQSNNKEYTFLIKPIKVGDLLSCVKQVLENKKFRTDDLI